MIYKYYLEIKHRCFLLLLTWIFSICISYYYKETLLFLCIKPSLLQHNNNLFYFIFTDIKEIFYIYIKLIIAITNQIVIYFFFCHGFIFFSLGLYRTEYTYLKKKMKFIFFFWVCSLLLLNNILLPISFNFFLSFQNLIAFTTLNLHFEAKLEEYLDFYLLFFHICAFYCQSFIFLIFFFDYINFNLKLIKKFRKFFYYFFICFSTAITPPDIISQILFTIILVFLYELVIFINLIKFYKNLL